MENRSELTFPVYRQGGAFRNKGSRQILIDIYLRFSYANYIKGYMCSVLNFDTWFSFQF